MSLVKKWIALWALTVAAAAAHAQTLDQTVAVAQQIVQDGAEAQNQVNQLDDQRDRALGEYRAVLQQIEQLRAYNAQLERRIAGQEREIVSLEEQIARVQEISRIVAPMIQTMIERYEQTVRADIPFFIDQRERRIQRLKDIIDRPNVSEGEKYRQILLAFQIERDYGDSLEAYEAPLIGDEEKQVTYVKYGRVALVYMTADESELGVWNHDERRFEPLPASYRDAIRFAIRVAKEQVPPDLVTLPVPAPADATR